MNVIFKNIPAGIKKYELAKYIESKVNARGIMREWFCVPIGDIDIVLLQGVDGSYQEQYGLIRIRSSENAKKVIKELNGSILNKLKIIAIEFFSRSERNDPRLRDNDTPEVFKEQRVKDRRGSTLVNSRDV